MRARCKRAYAAIPGRGASSQRSYGNARDWPYSCTSMGGLEGPGCLEDRATLLGLVGQQPVASQVLAWDSDKYGRTGVVREAEENRGNPEWMWAIGDRVDRVSGPQGRG